MAYTRVNFQDLPNTTTPVNATNLNKMDSAIKEHDDKLLGNTSMGNIVVNSITSTTGIDNYSTNETRIGTWINGKPLYRKVVLLGALPNAETKLYNFTIPNIDEITNYTVIAQGQTDNLTLPYIYPEVANIMYWITIDGVSKSSIQIITGVDRRAFNGILTIEYTKTTD